MNFPSFKWLNEFLIKFWVPLIDRDLGIWLYTHIYTEKVKQVSQVRDHFEKKKNSSYGNSNVFKRDEGLIGNFISCKFASKDPLINIEIKIMNI